jgi:hypothetical protein
MAFLILYYTTNSQKAVDTSRVSTTFNKPTQKPDVLTNGFIDFVYNGELIVSVFLILQKSVNKLK